MERSVGDVQQIVTVGDDCIRVLCPLQCCGVHSLKKKWLQETTAMVYFSDHDDAVVAESRSLITDGDPSSNSASKQQIWNV